MNDFDKQLAFLKICFTFRKDFSERRLPYVRKLVIVPAAPPPSALSSALTTPSSNSTSSLHVGGARNSTVSQGPEKRCGKSKCTPLVIPKSLVKSFLIPTTPFFSGGDTRYPSSNIYAGRFIGPRLSWRDPNGPLVRDH